MLWWCTGAQLSINTSKKKTSWRRRSTKSGGGLCCVGLEVGLPLRHIPSFIIHAAIYCTHIQYTPCKSLHSSQSWTGCGCDWCVGACTSTNSDCECPACRMIYCACVQRASHLSLPVDLCVCLLGTLAFSVPLITRENESMTHDSNLAPQFLCSGEAKQTFDIGCAENWSKTGRLLHLLHFVMVYILECVEILPL